LNAQAIIGNVEVAAADLGEASPTPRPSAGWLPAVIDLSAEKIHPIAQPFANADFPTGRNIVRAVQRGPFARVVNTGSCVNVREVPGTQARVLACAADGVLLRNLGETATVDDAGWLRVAMPAGAEGWASTQYLEY
jgi:hypothetical protein